MPSKEKYLSTISEAERFIEKAKTALATWEYSGNKHSASAKRASMDLTRALTEFRRP